MTKSMTAFARLESGPFSWEIRSVNHRYLDATFRIPERYRSVEPELRLKMRKKLGRGKIDCFLRLEQDTSDTDDFIVNEALLKKLLAAIEQTDKILGSSISIDSLEVLRWPGVLKENASNQTLIEEKITNSFQEALESLVAMRVREGEELSHIIQQKLNDLEAIVSNIRDEAPKIVERQRLKLEQRVDELKLEIDQGRFEQELVYLAQKGDIMEELDRLDTHVAEVRAALSQNEAVGRRLDFLMQELNREANTLSSKAVAANTSIQAVELKVIIEQMREQVQNIE